MAKQRVQTDLGLRPERLRPTASPVDTYVQPTSAASTGLGQLADALGDFAPEVARFSAVLGEKKAKEAQAAGIEAARKAQAEGKEYRDAIKDGTIHPSQSPWFRLGYEQQFGRVAAQKYSAAFMVEAAKVLSESTDIEDFDRVEQEFRARWQAEHLGPTARTNHFEEAFGNSIEGALDGLRRGFASQAGARMVQESNELLHQEVFAFALDYDSANPDATIAAIELTIARTLAQGTFTNPGAANRTVVDAVVNAAKRTNSLATLRLLDRLTTDKKSGSLMSGTKYASESIEQAENQISAQLQQDHQIQRQRQAEQEKEETDALSATAIKGILDGSLTGNGFQTILAQVADRDPAFAMQLSDARYKILNGVNTPDPNTLDEQSAIAYEGKMTVPRIVGLLRSGEIDDSGARTLYNIMDNTAGTGGSEKALKDPLYTFAASQFLDLFGDAMKYDNEASYRRLFGGLDFRAEWIKWSAENPNATVPERQAAVSALATAMAKKHASKEAGSGGDQLQANPYNWRENVWFSSSELDEIESRGNGRGLSDAVVDKINELRIVGPEINEVVRAQRDLLRTRR